MRASSRSPYRCCVRSAPRATRGASFFCLLALFANFHLRGQEPAVGLHAGSDFALAQYEAFGAWLGRDVMYRVVFLDKRSWSYIANPAVLATSKTWVNSRPGRTEVISIPLLPDGDDGNFQSITDGSRDDVFLTIATRIRNAAIGPRVILRLGWEGNATWYPWSYQRDPAGFRAAFRHVVKLMRGVVPELRFDFNIANIAARGTTGAKWTEGYPGDDVVDVISTDVYDHYNSWTTMMAGNAGLYELREFAKAHNKPEAFAEWACATTTAGHGDNAGFIRAMAAWMAARPGKVLYQAYWNSSEGAGSLLYGRTAALLPTSADTYKRLFGPNTPPTISALDDQAIVLNASTPTLSFTIGDEQTPVERLVLTVNSSNQSLVPLPKIQSGGSGSRRTISVAPGINRTGWSTITVKVSDGTLASVETFVVNVSAGLQFGAIGTLLLPGSCVYRNGAYTMQASGYDIYRQRDEFQFGQCLLTGDVELTVRLTGLSATHAWTKAGLMIRASLAADAAYVAVVVTPAQGVALQWRGQNGALAATSPLVPSGIPVWVRLLRTGDTFHAFYSNDGLDWEWVESVDVVLPATTACGLALTSHEPHALATATFDGFAID